MAVPRLEQYNLICCYVGNSTQSDAATPGPTSANTTHEPKRVTLPSFTNKTFATWCTNVTNWNTRYESSNSLDKYFDLMKALEQSEQGKELSEKLQLDGLNTSDHDIIVQCINKLKDYLDSNAYTKANIIMELW